MWTRALLKQNAKSALTGRYWQAFLVCLVASIFGVSGVSRQALIQLRGTIDGWKDFENRDVWTGNNPTNGYEAFLHEYSDALGLVAGVVVAILVVSIVIAVCWQLFLVSPLQVGRARFMMENRQGSAPFGSLFSTFRPSYMNLVNVSFFTGLKIGLGSLIIVPGILWHYEYYLVPYLLAENPYLTPRRAMELSRDMMDGEKWKTFVLELSFIGWLLLCGLTLGIGLYFLEPYYQATMAELYAALRSKALANGLSSESELGGFMRY